jgi:hypothetical protein
MPSDVAAIEPRVGLRFDDAANQSGNALQSLDRRLARDACGAYDAPFHHSSVVADPAAEKVGVRHHDLLPTEAAEPRALDAGRFHRAADASNRAVLDPTVRTCAPTNRESTTKKGVDRNDQSSAASIRPAAECSCEGARAANVVVACMDHGAFGRRARSTRVAIKA